jgi:hypothetical protein
MRNALIIATVFGTLIAAGVPAKSATIIAYNTNDSYLVIGSLNGTPGVLDPIRVEAFGSSLRTVAFDPTSGDLLVNGGSKFGLHEYTAAGNYATKTTLTDRFGELKSMSVYGNTVAYNINDSYLVIGSLNGTPGVLDPIRVETFSGSLRTVAFDPTSGDLFVNGGSKFGLYEYTAAGNYATKTTLTDRFGELKSMSVYGNTVAYNINDSYLVIGSLNGTPGVLDPIRVETFSGSLRTVAFDPTSGDLFVNGGSMYGLYEYTAASNYATKTTLTDSFGELESLSVYSSPEVASVPEPSSLVTFLGLFGMGIVGSRRRHEIRGEGLRFGGHTPN